LDLPRLIFIYLSGLTDGHLHFIIITLAIISYIRPVAIEDINILWDGFPNYYASLRCYSLCDNAKNDWKYDEYGLETRIRQN